MRLKSIIKNRIVFSGLAVFIGFFMLFSTAYASVFSPQRPDWWETADARLILNPFPDMGTSGEGTAEGTGDFDYSYMSFFGGGQGYFSLSLDNYNDPDKIKNIWMAYHITGDDIASYVPDISITGYIDNLPIEASINLNLDYLTDGWICLEAVIIPQPDTETFFISYSFADISFDYMEIGTKCVVPIPSALILFGGGLAGLVGLRRRKQK